MKLNRWPSLNRWLRQVDTEEDRTNTIRSISASRQQMTILIAHRLSAIMHADVIYISEKGKVREIGNHEELLQNKGLYCVNRLAKEGNQHLN